MYLVLRCQCDCSHKNKLMFRRRVSSKKSERPHVVAHVSLRGTQLRWIGRLAAVAARPVQTFISEWSNPAWHVFFRCIWISFLKLSRWCVQVSYSMFRCMPVLFLISMFEGYVPCCSRYFCLSNRSIVTWYAVLKWRINCRTISFQNLCRMNWNLWTVITSLESPVATAQVTTVWTTIM